MTVLTCIGKSVAVSAAVIVAAMMAGAILAVLGIPLVLIALAEKVGTAIFAYRFAVDHWDSRRPWGWAFLGFWMGLFVFPFLWYCHEHAQAAEAHAAAPVTWRYRAAPAPSVTLPTSES